MYRPNLHAVARVGGLITDKKAMKKGGPNCLRQELLVSLRVTDDIDMRPGFQPFHANGRRINDKIFNSFFLWESIYLYSGESAEAPPLMVTGVFSLKGDICLLLELMK